MRVKIGGNKQRSAMSFQNDIHCEPRIHVDMEVRSSGSKAREVFSTSVCESDFS